VYKDQTEQWQRVGHIIDATATAGGRRLRVFPNTGKQTAESAHSLIYCFGALVGVLWRRENEHGVYYEGSLFGRPAMAADSGRGAWVIFQPKNNSKIEYSADGLKVVEVLHGN